MALRRFGSSNQCPGLPGKLDSGRGYTYMGAENTQDTPLFCSLLLEPKLTSVDSVYSQADEVPCASNPSIAKVDL